MRRAPLALLLVAGASGCARPTPESAERAAERLLANYPGSGDEAHLHGCTIDTLPAAEAARFKRDLPLERGVNAPYATCRLELTFADVPRRGEKQTVSSQIRLVWSDVRSDWLFWGSTW
jgi:hypothetical protein